MCEMDNILQADKHPFAAQADIHHQPPKAAASLICVTSRAIIIKKEVVSMKENKLADISMDFSVQIINLVKELKSRHESVISNQIDKPDFVEQTATAGCLSMLIASDTI